MEQAIDETRREHTNWLVGFATIGPVVVGGLALLAALFAFVSFQWEGVGFCLLAAALAFGQLANAVLRR
jgi:hypothetical protein